MRVTVWDMLEQKTGRPHEEVLVELLNEHQAYEEVSKRIDISPATISEKVRDSIEARKVFTLTDGAKAAIAKRRNGVPA